MAQATSDRFISTRKSSSPKNRVVSQPIKSNELNFDELMTIAQGHSAFQLVWAGAEFDLFSLISKNKTMTKDQIAKALNLESQPTRILLHGLTSLRVLKKSGDNYSNSAIVEKCMVKGKPGCLIPLLGWQHHITYKGLVDFTESLRQNTNVGLRHFPGTGNTLYERLQNNPTVEKVFQDAMSNLSNQANEQMIAAINLSGVASLTDLGGGDGTNLIRIAERFPHLKGFVFDNATVMQLAEKNMAEKGMSDRLGTAEGNFLIDPLPETESFLLAHIMTIWSPQRNTALLKKCFDALPKGGKVYIFNMVSYDDETGPLINALGSPYFQAIATGEGMLYCKKDYFGWLRNAGFTSFKTQTLPMEHLLITAEK